MQSVNMYYVLKFGTYAYNCNIQYVNIQASISICIKARSYIFRVEFENNVYFYLKGNVSKIML